MKKILLFALAYGASAAFAATTANDPGAYKASMDKAAAAYKAAVSQCKSETGNAKTVCKQQAKAARAHAHADALAQYNTSSSAVTKARTAAVKADYDVAKSKCADSASDRNTCLRDAKSAHTAALSGSATGTPMATTSTHMGDTRTDANERSTAIAQARENCDNMDATAKAACLGRTAPSTTSTTSKSSSNVITDTLITTKVKAGMIRDPDLKAMDVRVKTVQGVVMLSGFVPSQDEAAKAVELARKVEGVTDVKSTLKVK